MTPPAGDAGGIRYSQPAEYALQQRHAHHGHPCPYCQQPLPWAPEQPDGLSLAAGAKRIAALAWHVLSVKVRVVRLVIAASFCIVSIVGAVFHKLALAVAHPADRRLLRGRRDA